MAKKLSSYHCRSPLGALAFGHGPEEMQILPGEQC